jgi:hypothetical protein
MFSAKNELFTSPSGYQISRSVRLRSSATAYFNRTPASATNRTTWTWSGWIKRGSLTSDQVLFQGYSDANNFTVVLWDSSDKIQLQNRVASTAIFNWVTRSVYRDPAAWYHVVAVYDSTQATSTNRIDIYVNGVEITDYTTQTTGSQNATGFINNTNGHNIGRSGAGSQYFDGYMTEVNFVDGQALTPSSFGEYDTITGVWKPKKYTGTYGTNGAYLNFSDNSASTAATIGKDYSGNGNNWTPNNISVTAGVTYDSMIDSPTSFPDGSTGRGNYATLNPLDVSISQLTLSAGNLIATQPSTGTSRGASSTFRVLTGKWYFEGTTTVTSGTQGAIAIADNANASTTYGIYKRGGSTVGLSGSPTFATYTNGDVIGVAFDADARTVSFYKNNTLQGTGGYTYTGTDPVGSRVTVDSADSTGAWQLNFGQRPFTYTPPSGFKALNTQNLPDATIKNGASYMAATLYTGNATVRSITNGGNNTIGTTFQPDFVWIKSRTPTAWSHELFDSLRGALNYLSTNLTAADQVEATSLTAFNSNGFSTGVWAPINGSGESLVAWQWNAGGSTVTNTSGSISAQVRANPTAGFSIVTYTGTGAAATIGHGLGVAPSMIIIKNRQATTSWAVYHVSVGANQQLLLNSTNAISADTQGFTATPSSTVFSVGTGAAMDTNQTTGGGQHVAYCFSAVAGYSAFGSYTGNASTDGPFVFTGFRPRWLMIKNSSSAGDDWILFDSSRDTYNVTNLNLRANTSGAESTQSANYLDFLSNGFKIRGTSAGTINASQTYIYMAFAENPFKYSLAR